MEREYRIGQAVIYVDPRGVRFDAVVTAWWASGHDHRAGSEVTEDARRHKESYGQEPGCNLVFVSSDVQKFDTYGRQIERETSVSHKASSGMPGRYWCWPDE